VDDTTRQPDDPEEPEDEGVRILGGDPDQPAPPDPDQFGSVPVIRPGDPPPPGAGGTPGADEPAAPGAPAGTGGGTELPHWTEPATGEVPRILPTGPDGEPDEDLAAWSTLTSATPRWRGHDADWSDSGDVGDLGGDLPRVGPADEGDDGDFFTFDDTEARPDPFLVPRDPSEPYGDRGTDPYAEARPATGAGRDVPTAIGVGVGLAVLALVLFNVGPAATMALVVVVLVLAVAEWFAALRQTHRHPATLVGVAATAALPLAAYWRGEAAIPLVLVLALVVSLLWWLVGSGSGSAVEGVGLTLGGIMWVGLLGSFAALLLRAPDGIGMLLAAVIGTVAYDVGGFVVGRTMGRAPLSAASPSKTVEGTVGGAVVAVVATVVITGRIAPFTELTDALLLGLAIAVVAPLGDLCESLVKRDLGIKDMGSILPGHGGLLDRFDALLFVLPTTYYVARVVL
jgi:phosphatidate cytidylyltransferase